MGLPMQRMTSELAFLKKNARLQDQTMLNYTWTQSDGRTKLIRGSWIAYGAGYDVVVEPGLLHELQAVRVARLQLCHNGAPRVAALHLQTGGCRLITGLMSTLRKTIGNNCGYRRWCTPGSRAQPANLKLRLQIPSRALNLNGASRVAAPSDRSCFWHPSCEGPISSSDYVASRVAVL